MAGVENEQAGRGDAAGGGLPTRCPVETLNVAVREHEVSAEWAHRERAKLLHPWFDRFNAAFFAGKLPTGLLQFERARCTMLGDYLPGRNNMGGLHQIRLNVRYLEGPVYEALGILLHEMVHQWEQVEGLAGRRYYHNQAFVLKSAELGIPCQAGTRGQILEYRDPFIALLRRHGIAFGPEAPPPLRPDLDGGGSKLKKWRCGCTNIRAAVEVEAQCLKCGKRFEKIERSLQFKLQPGRGNAPGEGRTAAG